MLLRESSRLGPLASRMQCYLPKPRPDIEPSLLRGTKGLHRCLPSGGLLGSAARKGCGQEVQHSLARRVRAS